MIEAHFLFEFKNADGFEQSQRTKRIGVGRIFRRFKADLHVTLRRQIIDFIRLRFLNQPDQIGRVGKVAVMQEKSRTFRMRVFI